MWSDRGDNYIGSSCEDPINYDNNVGLASTLQEDLTLFSYFIPFFPLFELFFETLMMFK